MSLAPGIYPGLSMAQYLALPAISAGVIRAIVDRCARAGWFESHRNPSPPPHDDTTATDTGSIAHSILLEGSHACVEVIDPANYPAKTTGAIPDGWTNNAIRAARDAARAAGKIPVLRGAMGEIDNMVDSARAYIESLRETEPAIWQAFQREGGTSEVTMVWEESGVLCKLRADRISLQNDLIIDYKTSARSVEPGSWGRTQLSSMGYYVSCAWYRRGVQALTGVLPDYVFLCQEVEAPYLCSLVGVDPAGLVLGAEKVSAGLQEWQRCERAGEWPAYPSRVCYPELPIWERARWDEREGVSVHSGGPLDYAKLFPDLAANGSER